MPPSNNLIITANQCSLSLYLLFRNNTCTTNYSSRAGIRRSYWVCCFFLPLLFILQFGIRVPSIILHSTHAFNTISRLVVSCTSRNVVTELCSMCPPCVNQLGSRVAPTRAPPTFHVLAIKC